MTADARRRVPRTDVVLADGRLAEAMTRLGRSTVKEAVAAGRWRHKTSHQGLQLARRDLAGTSTTVGVLGQPETSRRLSHPVTVARGQLMMITRGESGPAAANRGIGPAR